MIRQTQVLLLALICATLIGADRATAPATSSTRFRSIDILVDPHDKPLAAYQIEFTGESQSVKLVGIEGGAHTAFKDPPYYDPAALMHNHVLLAALNAGDDLPTGKTRVARLHLEITGEFEIENLKSSTRLITAATSDGAKIDAEVSSEEGAKP